MYIFLMTVEPESGQLTLRGMLTVPSGTMVLSRFDSRIVASVISASKPLSPSNSYVAAVHFSLPVFVITRFSSYSVSVNITSGTPSKVTLKLSPCLKLKVPRCSPSKDGRTFTAGLLPGLTL